MAQKLNIAISRINERLNCRDITGHSPKLGRRRDTDVFTQYSLLIRLFAKREKVGKTFVNKNDFSK